MSNFKAGDKVKCVNNENREHKIIEGKVYTVLGGNPSGETIRLKTELGSEEVFCSSRFVLAPEVLENPHRKDKKLYVKFSYRDLRASLPARDLVKTAYDLRKMAATQYKFDSNLGHKISAIRRKLREGRYVETTIKIERRDLQISEVCNVDERYGAIRKDIIKVFRRTIKDRRTFNKQLQDDCDSRGYSSSRGCHTAPNGPLNWFCLKQLAKTKKPLNGNRHIGIEIECTLPVGVNYLELVPFKDIVNLAEDGSIDPEKNKIGKEIRVLTTVDSFVSDVTGVCAALAKMGATANASCGLHVHLDMRKLPREEVQRQYSNLVRAQKFLQSLVDEKRRANTYCKPSRNGDPFIQQDRYRAINACSLSEHQTLEVRLHSGTVDAEEIINWIKLLLKIIDAPLMERASTSLDSFARRIKLPEDVKGYMEQRVKKFGEVKSVIERTICEEDHGDEICEYCSNSWSDHEGHECDNGERGTFPSCENSTEEII